MMKNLNRKNSISQNQTEKNGETQTRKRIKKYLVIDEMTLEEFKTDSFAEAKEHAYQVGGTIFFAETMQSVKSYW